MNEVMPVDFRRFCLATTRHPKLQRLLASYIPRISPGLQDPLP